jgi:soluble lytic murein transglycosylase-like protein
MPGFRSIFSIVLLFVSTSGYANEQAFDSELRDLLITAINNSDSFQDRFDAEVWLVDMSNRLEPFVTDDQKRINLLKQIHYEATRANLRPELVLAVIEIESRFDRFAISSAGALGLMQVMPFWLKEIGHPEDNLFDIHTNLRMGCTILRYYLDKENGNLTHALARYNGSLYSYKYTTKVYRALDRTWSCRHC